MPKKSQVNTGLEELRKYTEYFKETPKLKELHKKLYDTNNEDTINYWKVKKNFQIYHNQDREMLDILLKSFPKKFQQSVKSFMKSNGTVMGQFMGMLFELPDENYKDFKFKKNKIYLELALDNEEDDKIYPILISIPDAKKLLYWMTTGSLSADKYKENEKKKNKEKLIQNKEKLIQNKRQEKFKKLDDKYKYYPELYKYVKAKIINPSRMKEHMLNKNFYDKMYKILPIKSTSYPFKSYDVKRMWDELLRLKLTCVVFKKTDEDEKGEPLYKLSELTFRYDSYFSRLKEFMTELFDSFRKKATEKQKKKYDIINLEWYVKNHDYKIDDVLKSADD